MQVGQNHCSQNGGNSRRDQNYNLNHNTGTRINPFPLILNPPHPLIKPPLCYTLVLYWGDLVLGGWGGFSIRGKGLAI